MKITFKKITAYLLAVFNIFLSIPIFLQSLTLIDFILLKAGYLEGTGTIQFIKVFTGILAVFIYAFAFLAFVIFIFKYYNQGNQKNILLSRFLLISTIEIYVILFISTIYQTTLNLRLMNWRLLSFLLILIYFLFYIYLAREKRESK